MRGAVLLFKGAGFISVALVLFLGRRVWLSCAWLFPGSCKGEESTYVKRVIEVLTGTVPTSAPCFTREID